MVKQYVKRIIPNEGQKQALELMKEFNQSKVSKEFCLDGSGGTGKTTIIRELFLKKAVMDDKPKTVTKPKKNSKKVKKKLSGVKDIFEDEMYYVPKNVIGVTVSHKARMVLNEQLPNCITYAAAVNMTTEFDAWGEMVFVPRYGEFRQSVLYKYKYIVFDEASMVSDEMREILQMSCAPGAKIIYLGDHAQLPPIKPKTGDYNPDDDSSVFSLNDHYTLTEKMRQNEGDHISTLCDTVRLHIDGDRDISWIKDIKQMYDPQTKKGYSFSSEDKVIKSFVNNYNDGVDCRITAYRNKRIDYLNNMVRMNLFGAKAKEPYVLGDLIVGNDMYNPNNDLNPIFYNGEDMIIEQIYDSEVNDIQCYQLWAKHKKMPIYVVKDCDMNKYYSIISELKAKALKSKLWQEYMTFKNNYANISYGYAVTLYKIQGSTLYGCYVDMHDIFGVKPLSNKRKLQSIYVGFSRPTNFLAIF